MSQPRSAPPAVGPPAASGSDAWARASALAGDWAPVAGRILLALVLAVALAAGVATRLAALLAAVLLAEIVISLTISGGLSDLTLRDAGVLGLAITLTGVSQRRLVLRR